jgi:N6-L-threonylcarbamoyladenine synthase
MKKEYFKPEDLAASFQQKVVDILCDKVLKAYDEYPVNNIIIAGGVAANSLLRKTLKEQGEKKGIKVFYPSMKLCTDNGAMISLATYYKIKNGYEKEIDLTLNGIATLGIDKI